jgi:hypothetical protein
MIPIRAADDGLGKIISHALEDLVAVKSLRHNHRMRLPHLALLILVSCRAESPTRDLPSQATQSAPNVVFSSYARSSDALLEPLKQYEFTVRNDHFDVDKRGRVTCRRNGVFRGSFELSLSELAYVEELQVLPYGSDVLVLIYQVSDGENGMARISRIYLPTLKMAVTSDIPGFNIGQAALEGPTLYVSAIGFVGSFDVDTWGYNWTHGNLYEKFHFNSFNKPTVLRDRVIFPENVASSEEVCRNVVVQKSSGAMAIERQVVREKSSGRPANSG